MRKIQFLLFVLSVHAVCGQSLNTNKLDSLFDALSERNLAMGTIAIMKEGEVVYQRSVGYSSLEGTQKIPAGIQTRYRIGSVTKTFTAVMIFQLVEEGKIFLSTKLRDFFPGVPNADEITIRDLLYHRSGLHDYTNDSDFSKWQYNAKTRQEMLDIIATHGTDFMPRSKAAYSNTNYLLLGYIIEDICKMTYGEALKKRITSKLGLKNTYVGVGVHEDESHSYKYVNKLWKRQQETNLSIHGGAGAIVSTPTDMIKFFNALLNHQLVKHESLTNMKTMVDEYGMGLFANRYGSRPSFGHNGRIEEFYGALWYYPDHQLTFAYCTNGINYPRTDLIEGMLKICFNEPYEIPFSKPIDLTSEGFEPFIGQYSSKQVPIVVTCKTTGSKLLVETQGQTFETTFVGKNYFMHGDSGSFFEFFPDKGELQIKETDNIYYLNRN